MEFNIGLGIFVEVGAQCAVLEGREHLAQGRDLLAAGMLGN